MGLTEEKLAGDAELTSGAVFVAKKKAVDALTKLLETSTPEIKLEAARVLLDLSFKK